MAKRRVTKRKAKAAGDVQRQILAELRKITAKLGEIHEQLMIGPL